MITKHYHGDDSDVKVLLGGILQAFAGMTVDDYGAAAHRFLVEGRHPTLDRPFHHRGYRPMIDLLWLPGGQRVHQLHRLGRRPRLHAAGHPGDLQHPPSGSSAPPTRCATSRTSTAARSCTRPSPTTSTTGWSSRCGSGAASGGGPILAAGNSNGDIEMLRYAGGPSRPGLRPLVLHDDPEREFDYVAGAERALEEAKARSWTVVSVKRDWATVFG